MSINTSNSNKFRSLDSQNSIESSRREGVSSKGYRDANVIGNLRDPQGISGDGGLDYNLVYRSFSFPEQVGFADLVSRKEVLQELIE